MKIYHMFKRVVDIVVSLIGIILLSPLFAMLSIWVKFTSKGPIVYDHTRIGKDERPFQNYKFRSMVVGARAQQRKRVPTDKLITSSGKFLRKTFLDETLQLFNILKGDISLVGPRALDKEAYVSLVKKNKNWNKILKIRPGLTGLESVADYLPKKERIKFEKHFEGLKDIYDDFYKHRYTLNSYYIDNESFFLDIQILFYTFLLMVKRIFSK